MDEIKQLEEELAEEVYDFGISGRLIQHLRQMLSGVIYGDFDFGAC